MNHEKLQIQIDLESAAPIKPSVFEFDLRMARQQGTWERQNTLMTLAYYFTYKECRPEIARMYHKRIHALTNAEEMGLL